MRRGQPSINPLGRAATKDAVRTDAFVNDYTGHGTTLDASTATRHYTRPVSEREAIDLRRGNWLAKRIVEMRPADCFSRGYTLKTDDKALSEKLMTLLEERCVNEKLVEAGQMEATVGGAALFPVLDGATGDLADPLDLDDNPRILSVRAIHMFESRELQPETWCDDIMSPNFRKPDSYRLCALSRGGVVRATGVLIHASRLAIFPGVQVSNEQQPGQPWGWGDSRLTPVNEVIQNFGLSWGSMAAILRNFGERIVKVKGLRDILANKQGAAALDKWLTKLGRYRSTLRGELFDGDDEITTLLTSVAGVSDLMLQQAQLVSAAAEEPMTRLFGMSPGGMNATGEHDENMNHKLIANDQKLKYRSPLEFLVRLFMLAADGPFQGVEPDVWSVEFTPLKQQNEKEIAETRKLTAETDAIYVEKLGAPAESILRSRFEGDTFSSETTIDWAEYEKQKKVDEERAQDLDEATREAMGRGNDPVRPEDATADETKKPTEGQ